MTNAGQQRCCARPHKLVSLVIDCPWRSSHPYSCQVRAWPVSAPRGSLIMLLMTAPSAWGWMFRSASLCTMSSWASVSLPLGGGEADGVTKGLGSVDGGDDGSGRFNRASVFIGSVCAAGKGPDTYASCGLASTAFLERRLRLRKRHSATIMRRRRATPPTTGPTMTLTFLRLGCCSSAGV
jgi:hypothetical protein